ncbi:MAG: hypothetical protein QOH48_1780 [Actinomycetota bacterium]|nr:hypothetical protein [Actinomycetota bacterium]
MPPDTHYARSGDVSIAYQVVGDGPFDVVVGDGQFDFVFVPPAVSNVELAWEVPNTRIFPEGLASFSRVIQFDKRGARGCPTAFSALPRSRRGWTTCARSWMPQAPSVQHSSVGQRAWR